ncbi:MAG: acyltransferase family protein [Pseudomonadota bacterium]
MPHIPHIDGLRAIAILPVVAFHAGLAIAPGGFIGVDIFFVISGYLLTSIILRELSDGSFSFWDFYKRRVLRILPAYAAMIIAVGLVGSVILLPSEWRNLGDTMAAASLFVSNFHFWKTTHYFNSDHTAQPLLHTWTLSLEEQFYILLPIALFIIWRFTKPAFPVLIAALVVGPFASSVWGLERFETATFYLLPFRIWEFGIGALLATQRWPARLPIGVRHLAGVTGLALIVFGIAALDHTSSFPGVNALWPTVGAVLVIASGAGSWTSRLLSTPPLRFIGSISYALYLWHWPVIVFYKLRFGANLDIFDLSVVLSISFALAYLSTRFIEAPFRTARARSQPGQRVVFTGLSSLVVAAVIGLSLSGLIGALRPVPGAIVKLDAYKTYPETTDGKRVTSADGCMLHDGVADGFQGFDLSRCLSDGVEGKPIYLMIGDSHATHLMDALAKQLSGGTLQRAAAARCTPLLGTPGFAADHYCAHLMRHLFDTHIPAAGLDGIILSARWGEASLDDLAATAAKLATLTDRIIILGPTVEYDGAFPQILARVLWGTGAQASQFRRSLPPDLDARMKTISWPAKTTYISLIDIICPSGMASCKETTHGGAPYHFDYGHYTYDAAREIASQIDLTNVRYPTPETTDAPNTSR